MKTPEELRWEYSTISDYVPVKDTENWFECPECHVKPRVWRFDNGCFAKCQCSYKYEDIGKVSYTSIGEYYRSYKSHVGYDHDGLRKNWNMHCNNLEQL